METFFIIIIILVSFMMGVLLYYQFVLEPIDDKAIRSIMSNSCPEIKKILDNGSYNNSNMFLNQGYLNNQYLEKCK